MKKTEGRKSRDTVPLKEKDKKSQMGMQQTYFKSGEGTSAMHLKSIFAKTAI
jgi:hypothetical protein